MQITDRRLRATAALILLMGSFAAQAATPKIEPALLAAAEAGQVDFVIVLTDKADLSRIDPDLSKAEKGEATVAALQATASRSQAPVLAALAARGLPQQSFWVANVITSKGSLADVQALAARADVAGLYEVRSALNVLSPYILRANQVNTEATATAAADYVAKALGDPEPGLVLIHAPEVWAMGFTGQGIVVGDHDIGVQWDHPALKKKYRGWNDATQTATHAYNWRNAFGATDAFCADPTVPCDPNEHGTHTTGTMVGDDGAGNKVGVAPGAKWMACRSLLDPFAGAGTVPTYLDCMQWILAPYPNGNAAAADAKKSPDVVNNSWGCVEGCAPPVLKDVNDATFAAGIMQVVSAGNDGQGTTAGCSTIAFPLSNYESSFTVGASDFTDNMANFSSLGPVASDGSMRLKPNVTGPGVAVRSSIPTNGYGNLSGTSMSGPHVAGMAALVMSSEPRLKGRVTDLRTLIERTAVAAVKTTRSQSTCGGTPATTIPNNLFGYGRIDALAAVLARPQLVTAITAPATAKLGEDYTATVEVSQPATGKINATTVNWQLMLPATVQVVSSKFTKGATPAGATTYTLQFTPLAPGQKRSETLVLRSSVPGEVAISSQADAAQVSPSAGSMASAKTVVAAPATTTPALPVLAPAPTPAAATVAGTGRFGGGAFGGLTVLLLGLGAGWRRVRR